MKDIELDCLFSNRNIGCVVTGSWMKDLLDMLFLLIFRVIFRLYTPSVKHRTIEMYFGYLALRRNELPSIQEMMCRLSLNFSD